MDRANRNHEAPTRLSEALTRAKAIAEPMGGTQDGETRVSESLKDVEGRDSPVITAAIVGWWATEW